MNAGGEKATGATGVANVFACLVHSDPECIVDLVRNLRYLDPTSTILLYNGGHDSDLLKGSFPFADDGVVLHPRPRPMTYGRLHDFALDCMRYAGAHLRFDTLTIVDSDQLLLRPGYSQALAAKLATAADGERVGMLCSTPEKPPRDTVSPSPRSAFDEIAQWRPFLDRFPQGADKLGHWSFWPATVFTACAAEGLVARYDSDEMLRDIIARSRIWATEETILPSLVALLGFTLRPSPGAPDYVQYRKSYGVEELESALHRTDVFWMHPVPRRYDDPLRAHVRARWHDYRPPVAAGVATEVATEIATSPAVLPQPRLLRSRPILEAMAAVDGWLELDEADLLLAAAVAAVQPGAGGGDETVADAPRTLVEIGSYCGRATTVLGRVLQTLSPASRVFAIDPHEGQLGALDGELHSVTPTLERFRHTLAVNGLDEIVEAIRQRSVEVAWTRPINLLFIDGLHDYESVSRDYFHFAPWVVAGGLIAFHDYADYYPGVRAFVDELLAAGRCREIARAGTLVVVQKLETSGEGTDAPADTPCSGTARNAAAAAVGGPDVEDDLPLVSCIMPTFDRRHLVPQAITYFLRQDYPARELIVIDDGTDPIADLIPDDPRIRYRRLQARQSMGNKHNLACELATGDIICHWDDDDWMADRRLSYQVQTLLDRPPMTLCGLSHLLFYEPVADRAWEYTYPEGERPWVCGNTFCYWKALWERYRFADMNEGADTVYVWGLADVDVVAHPDPTFYVATVHPGNTSQKRTADPRFQPYPVARIDALLGDDRAFYDAWARDRPGA